MREGIFGLQAQNGKREDIVITHLDLTEHQRDETRRAREALTQEARLNTLGLLASSLIHELIQPLNAASFYCRAAAQLADGPAVDPQRLIAVIQRLEGQLQRAGDLLERLRIFLRGQEPHRLRVQVDQILARALDLVRWFAADHQVRLDLVAPERLPEIECDPGQIEQVLINLICNAIQAIDAAACTRRKVQIQVLVHRGEIECVVRDPGPGLPPGCQDAIFAPFVSSRDSGLGLAISRTIAEDHGGRLWAEPTSPEGAVFHLRLPTVRDERAGESNPTP
ncbi:MAG: sensor histidine kinase [Thermochromatium sp.]